MEKQEILSEKPGNVREICLAKFVVTLFKFETNSKMNYCKSYSRKTIMSLLFRKCTRLDYDFRDGTGVQLR